MKRKLEFHADMRELEDWLRGKSSSASGDMKVNIYALWLAYHEAADQNAVLTRVLVAAAAKGLTIDAPSDAAPPEHA